MPRQSLISTVWYADPSLVAERELHALTIIEKIFPDVTAWKAIHEHGKGFSDAFRVTQYDKLQPSDFGYRLNPLWESTMKHFARPGLNSDLISVEYCAWSDEINESINITFSDYNLRIDVEEGAREKFLAGFPQQFLQLLRDLGSCPAISGMWLRNDSAFAGDPACLYEPEPPFDVFHDFNYEDALNEVRAVRAAVRAALTPGQIAGALKELGVKRVEPLGKDRLFVQFAELGQPGGEEICKKLERQITERLKRRAK
jgi:hypothetical protein